MTRPQNIILVGFMATGKSHVGKLLSRKTGWPVADADQELENRAGKPIHRIFEEDGEPAFRALERAVISDLCGGTGRIIAAGGGAFVDPDSRRIMLGSGLVFCLSARPETIYYRVTRDSPTRRRQLRNDSGKEAGKDAGPAATPARPLLAGDNPLERIRTLLSQRSLAYAEAHHSIETDSLNPKEVARIILGLCAPLSPP